MQTYDYDQAEVEAVGAKLGSIEDSLTERERVLVAAIIARGLQGVREDAGEDVSGFGPAKLFVRKQGTEQHDAHAAPGIGGLTVGVGDPTGLAPSESFSLNFTKML